MRDRRCNFHKVCLCSGASCGGVGLVCSKCELSLVLLVEPDHVIAYSSLAQVESVVASRVCMKQAHEPSLITISYTRVWRESSLTRVSIVTESD